MLSASWLRTIHKLRNMRKIFVISNGHPTVPQTDSPMEMSPPESRFMTRARFVAIILAVADKHHITFQEIPEI